MNEKSNQTPVLWTRSEWEKLAKELLRAYPDRNLDRADGMLDIKREELAMVVKTTLPADRQRTVHRRNKFVRGLQTALARLRLPKAKRGAPDTKAIKWTDSEWQQFARALHQLYPEKDYLHSADMGNLTTSDMNHAAGAMPLNRQRHFQAIPASRPKLLAAYAALRTEDPAQWPAPKLPGTSVARNVVWTDSEWRLFAQTLLAQNPHLNLLHEPTLKGLTIRMLNDAAPVLPASRQRTFKSVSTSREVLLKTFEKLRAEAPAVAANEAAPAAPAAAPEPTPAPAPAAAVEQATAAEPAVQQRQQMVRWSRSEWVQVAAEIDRQLPFAHCLKSTTLANLCSGDVCKAQRVLPRDRQRPNLKTVSFGTMRASLLEAFATLRADAEKAEAEAALRVAEEAAQQAAQQVEAARLAAQVPAPAANPLEAALQPLVAALAQEMARQLVPALVQALQSQLPAALAPALPAAPPPAIEPVPLPAPPQYRQPDAPRLPHVGVLGNRNSYSDELAREFPQLRITCIDTADKIDALKNCAKVMVLTKFVSHAADKRARHVAGERYLPVNGALSDLKRVLTGLVNSGQLAAQARA